MTVELRQSVRTHKVYLDAFWIDRTEVTNAMYAMCVLAKKCPVPNKTSSLKRSDYYSNPLYADFPVINVTWTYADAYCTWAGRRLPSEAEWEKAARGTEGKDYPWGNTMPGCSLLDYSRCVGDTVAVGSYPLGASPYGALDMAGNAWEWVNDWYSNTYYNDSLRNNPLGPASGNGRVVRGGGNGSTDVDIHVYHRANEKDELGRARDPLRAEHCSMTSLNIRRDIKSESIQENRGSSNFECIRQS